MTTTPEPEKDTRFKPYFVTTAEEGRRFVVTANSEEMAADLIRGDGHAIERVQASPGPKTFGPSGAVVVPRFRFLP